MRVLWITPGFAADETDTTCIPPLQALAKAIAPQVELRILAINYPFKRSEYHWSGIPVYSAGGANRRDLSRLLTAGRLLQQGWRFAPDVVHSFWMGPAALLGHWLRRPQVITLMGQDANPKRRYLSGLPHLSRPIISISAFQDARFTANTGIKTTACIPWGLPDEDFPVLTSMPTQRHIDVLGVGSLIELKQWDHFLDVVALLHRHRPVRATLVGEGPLRQHLASRVQKEQLPVEFTGAIPRQQVLELMQQSRVLLHPSAYESFGYVFLEGMASGMGLVSYLTGAAQPAEHWRIGQNIEQLATEVNALLQLPDAFFSPRPVMRMAETATAYLEFYKKLHLKI